MRNTARLLALLLALWPAVALSQSAPANLPYHTFYGRLGAAPGDTGPGQAIPFTTLFSQLVKPPIVSGDVPCFDGATGAMRDCGPPSPLPNAVGVGADPTGTLDSTTPINAAINSNGGLFFPCGSYKVSQVAITASRFTSIIGAANGWGGLNCVTIFGTSQTNSGVISVQLGNFGYSIKNILVDHVVPSATVTITSASPAVISWSSHGLPAGSAVTFNTTGALYTGIVANTIYYVSTAALTTGTFQIADTQAHALAGTNSINTSGSQGGVHTAYQVSAGAGIVVANGQAGDIESVTAQNQLTGFSLGATSSSLLQNSTAAQNFGDAYAFTNDSDHLEMQWILEGNNFALQNSGYGFHVTSSVVNNPSAVGPLFHGAPYCFNNSLGCLRFDGASGSAIADVLIAGMVSSGGGGPAIDFENAGINTNIHGGFIELRGTGGYGRNSQTPTGTTGAAVLFSTGGDGTSQPQISGMTISGCSQECIKVATSALITSLKISDTTISDAGLNTSGLAAISLLNPSINYYLSNVTARNAQGSTAAYGLRAAVGANVYLNGVDFSGNATAGCIFNDSARPNSNGIAVGNGCAGFTSAFQAGVNQIFGVEPTLAPTTPGAGSDYLWPDPTDHQWHGKNPSGTLSTMVVPQACTNQVFTSLSSPGALTCASVSNAMLANSSITINGSSVSLGGSITTGAAPTGPASGDLTGSYPNPTLNVLIASGGPTGSATVAPIITYDTKGRLTAVSSATITPAVGSITGLGTGVGAALATSIGSAGAPTLFNGAHGTPSSIVLTNATGTAASLTVGTANAAPVSGLTGAGTGVTSALGTNVGTAGSFVVNGGALGTPSSGVGTNITNVNAATLGGATFASPGAIGGTTAAAGSFTSVSASGLHLSTSFNSGYQLKNAAGSQYLALTSGSSGNYTIFENPDSVQIFQGGNSTDPANYYSNTTHQFTNLAISVNYGKFDASGLTVQTGNVIMSNAAKTLVLKQGANGSVGTFVCTSGGSITVANSNVATTDAVIISLNTAGGTISTPPALNAITAATSFVAKCAASDTSTYNYSIIKNAA